ncbi:MAG: hypothetical protein HYZ00_00425 [Candidatus Hydrogenedentes bacterium]|nr:hypothetical protein [Candidatus Hydrogenedentota bacterium]
MKKLFLQASGSAVLALLLVASVLLAPIHTSACAAACLEQSGAAAHDASCCQREKPSAPAHCPSCPGAPARDSAPSPEKACGATHANACSCDHSVVTAVAVVTAPASPPVVIPAVAPSLSEAALLTSHQPASSLAAPSPPAVSAYLAHCSILC